MAAPHWVEIDHTADWAIRVWGEDYRALFEHAAHGMVSLLGDAHPTEITFHRTIQVTSFDLESLLVDWLTEIVYILEDHQVFSEIKVIRIEGMTLEGEVTGGPPDEPFNKHIKAVTYHLLEFKTTDEGIETTLVFDV
jgi:SHS2 domain-containing protein